MKSGQRGEEPEAKKPSVPEDPVVLTVPQTAKLLQVNENHLYALIGQGAFRHLRFGEVIRIPRWGLLQYLAPPARRHRGRPQPAAVGAGAPRNGSCR
jgi:excisionase family DNA binding protein